MLLGGKIINTDVPVFLNDERSTRTMGAKRYGQTINSMPAWLREAGVENGAKIRARLDDLEGNISMDQLLLTLEKRHAKKSGPDKRRTCWSNGSRHAWKPPRLGLFFPSAATRRENEAKMSRSVVFEPGLSGSDTCLAGRDDLGRIEGTQAALEGLVSDDAAITIAGIDRDEATLSPQCLRREHPRRSCSFIHPFPPPRRCRLRSPWVKTPNVVDTQVTTLAPSVASRNARTLVYQVKPRQTVWVCDEGTMGMGQLGSFECKRFSPSWMGLGGVVAYAPCQTNLLEHRKVNVDLNNVCPNNAYPATAQPELGKANPRATLGAMGFAMGGAGVVVRVLLLVMRKQGPLTNSFTGAWLIPPAGADKVGLAGRF